MPRLLRLAALALCLALCLPAVSRADRDDPPEPPDEEGIKLRHVWTYDLPPDSDGVYYYNQPSRIFLLQLDYSSSNNGWFTDLMLETNVGMGVIRGVVEQRDSTLPYPKPYWTGEIELFCIPRLFENTGNDCDAERIIITGASAGRYDYDYQRKEAHTTPREDILRLISAAPGYPRATFANWLRPPLPEASGAEEEIRIMQVGDTGMYTRGSPSAAIRLTFPPGMLDGAEVLAFGADTGLIYLEGEDILKAMDPRQPDSLRISLDYASGVIDVAPREGIGLDEFRLEKDNDVSWLNGLLVQDPFRPLPIEVCRP